MLPGKWRECPTKTRLRRIWGWLRGRGASGAENRQVAVAGSFRLEKDLAGHIMFRFRMVGPLAAAQGFFHNLVSLGKDLMFS